MINWAGRAKPAGLSFLIVNLGVPWTLPINQCSRGVVLNVCCSTSLEGNCHTWSSLNQKQNTHFVGRKQTGLSVIGSHILWKQLLLESVIGTRVQSSHSVKNVSRAESNSPKILTRFESSHWLDSSYHCIFLFFVVEHCFCHILCFCPHQWTFIIMFAAWFLYFRSAMPLTHFAYALTLYY